MIRPAKSRQPLARHLPARPTGAPNFIRRILAPSLQPNRHRTPRVQRLPPVGQRKRRRPGVSNEPLAIRLTDDVLSASATP